MKNCPNCNHQLEDDAILCPECGANLEPQAEQTELAPKKPSKKHLIIGGAICVAVLAIILSLILSLFGPKALARKYVKASFNGNAKQYVNCMPSFMWEDKEEKKDLIEMYEEYFDEEDNDYKRLRIEKIVVQKFTKEEREEVEDVIERLEKAFDNLKEGKIKARTFRKITVFITYKDEDGVSYAKTMSLVGFKYKGQWKVFSLSPLLTGSVR